MDKIFLLINNFALNNLVSIKVEFNWFYITIDMLRDNYKQSIMIDTKELESVNSDIVIKSTLDNMLNEINKNYEESIQRKEESVND